MVAVEDLCRRAIWLERGRVLRDGRSREVIAEYLHRSTSATIGQVWPDIATAPGNDDVRLRAARVLPASGARNTPIDVATDFIIEIEYWNLTPSERVTISVNVHREDGLLVFSTGTLEPIPRGKALNRETGRVPGNLMNDGFYTIELAVVYGQRSVYRHENLLGFHIADRADLRAGWFDEWPGAVRPILQWQTELITSAETSDGTRNERG